MHDFVNENLVSFSNYYLKVSSLDVIDEKYLLV